MKKIYIVLFTLLFLNVKAQFTINSGQNANDLAQYLAGNGVTISNAVINCVDTAYGIFTDAPAGLGITDGVLLTSGSALAVDAPSTNFSTIPNESFSSPLSDPDLDAIITPIETHDRCALEFDITVIGDTLQFNYVFSSEEYTSYVCSDFNDVFAFFISGPNPAGGTYNTQNIALIPGTNIPVSINTVNDGVSDGQNPNCDLSNTAYYNNSINNIVYDGNTVVLQAIAPTVPCATYHFKLAIADGGDATLDSGVFLEEGSFSSTGTIVSAGTVLGTGFNTMVEGCVNGQLDFILEDGINTTIDPIVIHYSFSGTATHLVDFVQVPFTDSVIIMPGDSMATVELYALADVISEGIETIEINIETSCGGVFASSIEISDDIPLVVNPINPSMCDGDSVTITLSGAQTYSWLTIPTWSNAMADSVLFSPAATTAYIVQTTLGTCTYDSTISILVSNFDATLNSTPISCATFNDGALSISTSNAVGGITYDWSTGDVTNSINNLSPGIYQVFVSDGACIKDLEYEMIDPASVLVEMTTGNIAEPDMIENCIDATITYTLTSGINNTGVPIPIVIDFGGSATEGIDYQNMPDTVWVIPGQNSVTITITSIADGVSDNFEDIIAYVQFPCGLSPLDTINLNDEIPLNMFISNTTICQGDFVDIFIFDNYNFQWEPTYLITDPSSYSVSFFPDTSIDVTLTYSFGSCSFTEIIPITVNVLDFDIMENDISCAGENDGSILLTPTNGTSSNLTYTWSTGSANSGVSNLSPGIYFVDVMDDNFCFYSNSFDIQESVLTMEIIPNNNPICKNEIVEFDVIDNLSTNATYSWTPSVFVENSNAKNTNSIPLTSITTFSLTGTNPAGCNITKDITIEVNSMDIEPLFSDTTIGVGTTIGSWSRSIKFYRYYTSKFSMVAIRLPYKYRCTIYFIYTRRRYKLYNCGRKIFMYRFHKN